MVQDLYAASEQTFQFAVPRGQGGLVTSEVGQLDRDAGLELMQIWGDGKVTVTDLVTLHSANGSSTLPTDQLVGSPRTFEYGAFDQLVSSTDELGRQNAVRSRSRQWEPVVDAAGSRFVRSGIGRNG